MESGRQLKEPDSCYQLGLKKERESCAVEEYERLVRFDSFQLCERLTGNLAFIYIYIFVF